MPAQVASSSSLPLRLSDHPNSLVVDSVASQSVVKYESPELSLTSLGKSGKVSRELPGGWAEVAWVATYYD